MMGSITSLLRPLAYLSLPVLAFRFAATKSKIVRYYWRIGLYSYCLAACSILGVCLSVVLFVIGKRLDTDFWVARSFHFLASRALDITFEIEGEEHLTRRPALLLGNHQSMLDILYLGPIFPRSTVISAKKELRWTPFLGLFMILGGTIFLDRRNPEIAIASLKAAGETMKRRQTSLWMFPEGTRSLHEEPMMKPFKKGAFHVAVQSGLPIVPVVCENYWRLYRKNVFESGKLKIKVLPPIETTGLTTADVPALAERTREIMVKALQEISVPYKGPSAVPSKSERDAILMPPPPVPASSGIASDVMDRHARREPDGADQIDSDSRQRTSSLVRSIASSEETEEEDGHVLVRRPDEP
ncbi:1-acylglycerol-3-phosphate O-acyltransferase [Serendipita sp. 405]|nr:1-acylglycerol-3-phosphate O-acyltransferase [Serendipita sp. 405]